MDEERLPQKFDGSNYSKIIDDVTAKQMPQNEGFQDQLATAATQYFENLGKGIGELSTLLKGTEHIFQVAGNERAKMACLSLLRPELAKPLQQVLPLSQDGIETTYSNAYHLYNSNQFEKACDLFASLCMHAPQDARFIKGLAACCTQLHYVDLAKIILDQEKKLKH